MDDWETEELRHEAKTLRKLGENNKIDTPYGEAEIATYGLCAEGMEWAADEIERLQTDWKSAMKSLFEAKNENAKLRAEIHQMKIDHCKWDHSIADWCECGYSRSKDDEISEMIDD